MADCELNVRDILRGWLADHGDDGLYSPGNECCCSLGDLAPCDNPGVVSCRPGRNDPQQAAAHGVDYWITPPAEPKAGGERHE
jgi:hypothetical protein